MNAFLQQFSANIKFDYICFDGGNIGCPSVSLSFRYVKAIETAFSQNVKMDESKGGEKNK